jgi:hypothetical protein
MMVDPRRQGTTVDVVASGAEDVRAGVGVVLGAEVLQAGVGVVLGAEVLQAGVGVVLGADDSDTVDVVERCWWQGVTAEYRQQGTTTVVGGSVVARRNVGFWCFSNWFS